MFINNIGYLFVAMGFSLTNGFYNVIITRVKVNNINIKFGDY